VIRLENSEVAAIFQEMADLTELQDGNPFRIRSFRRVAQAIATLQEQIATMLAAGTLAKVPGVGEGTLTRVREILETGDCVDHKALRAALPAGLLDLLRIEGMGPKTVKLVYTTLGVKSVDELEAAAQQGHLAKLPRMGEKSQTKLLKAIEAFRRHSGRIRLGDALPQGLAIAETLRGVPGLLRVELAGSCRRRQETIGDLDVLVASEDSGPAMDAFCALPAVGDVIARGETKCSVHLSSGLQVDLRVISPRCFGAALHYFTGSKMHNIAVRDRAKRRGLKISEYGVFREGSEEFFCGATEEEIFASVGLAFIPPELRENLGEIEAAEEGRLPALIEERHLRGDLHMHTLWSDGTASAREMAEQAIELGYEYLAITDHSRALSVARGLDEVRLAEQGQELRALEAELGGSIRILRGIEVDILPEGELDLSLEALASLDWVVASVHSHFNLPEEKMTARVIRALETGVVDSLGHPSGRLLGQRDAFAINLDQVIRAARDLGVAMELNAFPDRLDLDAPHCRQAKELGVPVAICTDSHATWHLKKREFGIATARRGWLEPTDVLNAGPLETIVERRRERIARLLPAASAQRASASSAPASPARPPRASSSTRKPSKRRRP
jgi:DNA polymerase (family 10)